MRSIFDQPRLAARDGQAVPVLPDSYNPTSGTKTAGQQANGKAFRDTFKK